LQNYSNKKELIAQSLNILKKLYKNLRTKTTLLTQGRDHLFNFGEKAMIINKILGLFGLKLTTTRRYRDLLACERAIGHNKLIVIRQQRVA